MRMVLLASHTHCPLHIFPESEPVEEACEDVKHPIQPQQLGQGKDFIVVIKI